MPAFGEAKPACVEVYTNAVAPAATFLSSSPVAGEGNTLSW